MAYLKYYSNQRSIHAAEYALKMDFSTAVSMAQTLFEHFNVPAIPVKLFVKGAPEFKRLRKVKSWYNGNFRKEIVMHPTMLNPATLAHEVAHYVDHSRHLAAHRSWGRAHTNAHAALIAEGIDVLKVTFRSVFNSEKTQEALALKALKTIGPEIMKGADDIIANFYAGLPEKLTCPCCSSTLPKMNFGVRVMKRDSLGVPVIIRRQSYCKSCR